MGVMVAKPRARGIVEATYTVATGTKWAREFPLGVLADGQPPSILRLRDWWDWHAVARANARRTRAVQREIKRYREQIIREGYVPPG